VPSLRLYSDEDLALTEAMETDPAVMSELGGPVPHAEIPALHRRRLHTVVADPWWFVVVSDDGEPAGEIGIWETEHDGATVHETGWMLARRFHGRGLAGAALALLLERARAEPRFERLHAWPGVTNAASNALCRKFGFELLGEEDGGYRDARLRVNHWVLALR
jgi:RimJ/RimL family protein N-acetyltransferase